MARIPMTSGFMLVPEGTYVFRIKDVKYDDKFGKLEVIMETEKGLTYTERYSLLTGSGELNERALAAFSYFAKTALQSYDIESIEHTDLIGHFIKAEVIHTQQPSTREPGKMVTFANLGDKFPADGFEPQTYEAKSTPKPAPQAVDLDALLG